MVGTKTAAALIVAAGASRRMGFGKLGARIGGMTVLERSLRGFESHPMIDEIVLVAGKNMETVRRLAERSGRRCRVVAGGAGRCDMLYWTRSSRLWA